MTPLRFFFFFLGEWGGEEHAQSKEEEKTVTNVSPPQARLNISHKEKGRRQPDLNKHLHPRRRFYILKRSRRGISVARAREKSSWQNAQSSIHQ